MAPDENQSLWKTYLMDGPRFLSLTGLALIGSGSFALFLTFSRHFLPHDAIHVGFTAEELSLIAPNLVEFMFHDRAAFGGALIAMGVLYLWLSEYPLRAGRAWAWQIFVVSGVLGFGSFLSYIGYGYLDTWHGFATLFLLPVFIAGLAISRKLVSADEPRKLHFSPLAAWIQARRKGAGFGLILCYSLGLVLGGASILAIGMTSVFVPQDTAFIELCGDEIDAISETLIPVIAHDRVGFGGALLTIGVTLYLTLLNAPFSLSLFQTVLLSGSIGFASAIGIHFYVGYTDFIHLLPAYSGAVLFYSGLALAKRASAS